MSQVSMALYGGIVPGAKKSEDQEASDLIFDILALLFRGGHGGY